MRIGLSLAYQKFLNEIDRSPGRIDKEEAQKLIQMAEVMNEMNSGCCWTSNKGDRQLNRLLVQNADKFDRDSRVEIKKWLKRRSS